jgi:predicted membrane protein
VKKLILSLTLSAAASSQAAVEKMEFPAKELNHLSVKNIVGEVEITVSKDDKAYVQVEKVTFKKGCSLETAAAAGTLKVKIDKEDSVDSDDCKVNFKIQVPKKIAMNLKYGAGNMTVKGTSGEVTIKSGAGNTKIDAEVTKLNAKTGAGNLEIKGLTGDASIKTGAGNITATYSKAPAKGNFKVKSGVGNVTVFLPETAKVNAEYKSAVGRLTNEFATTTEGAFKVSVKSAAGTLNLKKIKN